MNTTLKGVFVLTFLLFAGLVFADAGSFGFPDASTGAGFPDAGTIDSGFPDTGTAGGGFGDFGTVHGDFSDPGTIGGGMPSAPTPTAPIPTSDSGDFGTGDNGFEFIPFPTTPMGPNTPPLTNDLPAHWNSLHDVTILQGTRDNSLVYPGIANECDDPDTPEFILITSTHNNYRLFLDGSNLRIFGLFPVYLGTETVTLSCNGVEASFSLTVAAKPIGFDEPISEGDDLEVSIGAIALPENSQPGDFVPVFVSFRNTGDKKLDNVNVRVSLPDLGIMSAAAGPFDLSKGKRTTQTLLLELPEQMEQGYYAARITIDSESLHRIVHRDLVVE